MTGPGLHVHDDFPFHQAILPMGYAVNSDPRFNDGYYFALYRPGRHVFCGLRFHPNNNVVDGYAGWVGDSIQSGFRASRALDADRASMSVGPLRIEVIEPMVTQRVICDSNEFGIEFDLEFRASCQPFFETPHLQYRHGRLLNHVLRYTQTCRASGRIVIDGVEEVVDDWYAARDHSWGVRHTMGPALSVGGAQVEPADPRALRLWVPFEVGGKAGFFHLHEDHAGRVLDCEGTIETAGEPGNESAEAIVGVRHTLRYVDGTQRLEGGRFVLELESGNTVDLEFEVACDPAFPQGFGYARGWCDGGNPGVWRGIAHIEGERFAAGELDRTGGPPHTTPERRLGGTEFASVLHDDQGEHGMAHVEHMLYRQRRP